MSGKPLTDEIPSIGTDLHHFAPFLQEPVDVLHSIFVPLDLFPLVGRFVEVSNRFKVLLMKPVRSADDDKSTVVGTIRRKVGDALTELDLIEMS